MPVFLKDIKKELESDVSKVGRNKDGSYKFTPPSIVGRKISKYPKLRVFKSKLSTKIFPAAESLTYSSVVKSEKTSIKSEPSYKVSAKFFNLKFKDIESDKFPNKVVTKVGNKNVAKYYATPTVQKNPVQLKCQCQDFRHRFETELSQADGLIGAPRKYNRKTPPWPTGYPYANSTNKLGICKHISSFLEFLKNEGLLKER